MREYDPYKDMYNDGEGENSNLEQKWVSLTTIKDNEILGMIKENLQDVAKQSINYAIATTENLRAKGFNIKPIYEAKPGENEITITITFRFVGISQERLVELTETTERLRYLRQIRQKPRGVHAKRN